MSPVWKFAIGTVALAGIAHPAHAEVGFADRVIEFFDAGNGPIVGPYGGDDNNFPVPVSPDVVLGPPTPDNDFLSLPTGSFVTVAFDDEIVVDGEGNDIFIAELGSASESAGIFVSANLLDFVFLGFANNADGVSSFDLGSIGFTEIVRGVRIVGNDTFGGSPGFDLDYVQALPGAFTPGNPGAVPEPAAWALLILGFAFVGGAMRWPRGVTKVRYT
ncbi:hypothetical protein E3U23_03825 [Erythrobacter litoralis]|uniref:PEPxxWA-CTERM sorting domain-containing protein n=1 Tax=Erythrobacter litoralis TaxID=39960 RepID=UPI002435B530|nr:PEPxxWA-CTERM sorting domain-containing protein [Erythrobacter litoralis]MDG6078318.1 hypothetical protein [Erythrobacter litoralis]